ncbi:hypothetical protein J0H58_15825 [bacterium]|nr:hypothetical protein [bacterium]
MRIPSTLLLAALVAGGCNKPKPAAEPAAPQSASGGSADADPPLAKRPPGAWVELYGETGGEATLPPDEAPPSAPLRARKADTFFTLSKPRIAPVKNMFPPPPPGGGQVLAVDYVRTTERALSGNLSVVIRTAGGKDHTVNLKALGDRAGTIELQVANRGPWSGALPKDAELYLVRSEGRYGKAFSPTFKVSNSVVMGKTDFPVTRARDWTADEAKALAVPPVEAPKANANPSAGEDTPVAGAVNAFKQRFAEPGKPLLGFDSYDWFWPVEGGKEECLSPVVPIYDRAYPDMGQRRTLAKQGYAVGGLEVKSKTYVNGIRVTFMRLKADGTLNPADTYQSGWLGPHTVGTKETKLGGDGRPVIGLTCYQAGHLSGIGLVLRER